MPQVRRDVSLATTVESNVMSGQLFERVGPAPSLIRVYAATRTAGIFDVDATLILGSDTIIRAAAVPLNTNGVVIPDHQIAVGTALPGDQIFFNIHNANASTANVSIVVDIEPIA